MKKSLMLGAAIAAVLGSSSAFALGPLNENQFQGSLVVSGSSAFKAAFETELNSATSSICVAGTFNRYVASSGQGDFNAYTCTAKTDLGAGIANPRNLIIYYRGEGGSVFGVTPIGSNTQVLRLQMTSTCTAAAPPAAGTCTATGFNPVADTATSGLVNALSQLGISDEEPAVYTGENYPDASTSTKLQVPFTAPAGTPLVGQAFGVYVKANGAGTAGAALGAITSLSKSTIGSIFQGVYADWNQVPKNDGSNTTVVDPSDTLPIVLCRREAGSGTQVAASIFFNGKNCGSRGDFGFASTANPVNLGTVIENNSTGALRTCLANPGAIGFLVIEADQANFKQIQIDGKGTNNLANVGQLVAQGDYSFVFEATAQKRAGLSGFSNTVADKLISISQRQATGPTSRNVTFLPAFNGANAVFPTNTPAGKQPVSCFTRGGNSCSGLQNAC